jgi:hypothetical protein
MDQLGDANGLGVHEEFNCIKYADVAKRGNVRVS